MKKRLNNSDDEGDQRESSEIRLETRDPQKEEKRRKTICGRLGKQIKKCDLEER